MNSNLLPHFLGAHEHLIGQFAASSGKKAGEFYTSQQISSILSAIVTLDSQGPMTGKKKKLNQVLDFACQPLFFYWHTNAGERDDWTRVGLTTPSNLVMKLKSCFGITREFDR